MKTKYIISAVLLIMLLAACNSKKEEATTELQTEASATQAKEVVKKTTFTNEQYKLADIEVGNIRLTAISDMLKLNGIIEVAPQSKAMLSAPLGGYIKSAGFIPGQMVAKGEVVAVLENKQFIDLQQEYLQSKSQYTFLQQEFERQRTLRESDVNAVKTFQQVTADLESTKAKVKGLEQTLSLAGIHVKTVTADNIQRTANLYAPISGYIKTSNITTGNYANPNDALLEIVDINNLYINLNAFEKDINALSKGQKVNFCLANESQYNRNAEIAIVGKSASTDKIISVNCTVNADNKNGLLPGMYIKAWIETLPKQLPTVPNSAIVNYDGNDYIILETVQSSTGKEFSFCKVSKGITQEGITAITLPSSVNMETAKVVIKNAYTILSALINSEEE